MLVPILVSIAILIALVLFMGLFTPKSYIVQRSINIRSSKKDVFDYLRLLTNHDNFSKWAKIDPDMKKTYKGTDGTVGFQSAWDSKDKKVGAGEQEILKIEEGQRINFEVRFLRPFKSVSKASFITERVTGAETKVIWTFNGVMNYPMNIMLWFMKMDKMLGPDLLIGLENLKRILEK